jgi:hypothetical protein
MTVTALPGSSGSKLDPLVAQLQSKTSSTLSLEHKISTEQSQLAAWQQTDPPSSPRLRSLKRQLTSDLKAAKRLMQTGLVSLTNRLKAAPKSHSSHGAGPSQADRDCYRRVADTMLNAYRGDQSWYNTPTPNGFYDSFYLYKGNEYLHLSGA